MKNHVIYIILILGSCILSLNSHSQITRGAQSGEFYLSTDWYIDNYEKIHYAIFHSTDNGEHIALKYENIEIPPYGEMTVDRVLGDATTGALYNYGNNELWVSFDYGESWEFRENFPDYTRYWGGEYEGILYKGGWGLLYKSNDYALTYEIVSDPPNCPISDVGFFDGEFYGIDGNAGEGFFLYHTHDYANTYTEIQIDSSVAFWSIGGYWPKISRGTGPGELYLVSWWLDYHYKIFLSVDTGYTWIEKYESDYINQYFWEVQYTAGRQPGSFYVMRSTVAPAGDHIWLYIDYSSDYGETFTTCFHDLDSLFTSITPIKKPDFKLLAYPNPLSVKTTIVFDLPENCKTPVLNICNMHGKTIRQYNITGKKSQQWDGRDSNGNLVPHGVYLYNIKYGNVLSQFNKLLFINQKQQL